LKHFDGNDNYYKPRYPENPNRIEWQPSLRFGKRQMSMDDPRNIFNYLAELRVLYPYKPYRLWSAALTGFYDRTYVFEKFQPLPSATLNEVTELAFSIGHEYRVGRVGVMTDLGLYLYRPYDIKRKYYQGLGVRYYVSPRVIAQVRLRTHLSMADYMEWGLSYRIQGKKTVRPGFFKDVFRKNREFEVY
jgi:hypothetical protein